MEGSVTQPCSIDQGVWHWRDLASRPYTLAFLIISVPVTIQFLTRTVSQWDLCFVPTAAHLVAGEDIYDQPHAYTYPPFQSLLAVPVVSLPVWAQRLYWLLISLAAGAWLLRRAWALAGGPELESGRIDRREHVACCLGLLASAPFLLNCLAHQQTDLVIVALVIGGVYWFCRERSLLAGAGIGVAAAMKCTPVLFAPYFLWRRRWAAAAALVAAALAASLLPDLFHRTQPHDVWLVKWYGRFLAPMAQTDFPPGRWYAALIDNQSVNGAINRWTGTRLTASTGSLDVVPTPQTMSASAMRRVVLVLAMACGVLALGAMLTARRRRLSWQERVPWECGMVVIGMLLFSPMSSLTHFGLLVLPGFLVARAVLVHRQRSLTVFLVAMVLAGVASNKDLVGGDLYALGKWYGLPMWSSLAAFFGCVLFLMTKRTAAESITFSGRIDVSRPLNREAA